MALWQSGHGHPPGWRTVLPSSGATSSGRRGVDTATVLLLRTVGVPLDVALLGVVTHRVFAFWIPLVPGSVFALTLLRLNSDRDNGHSDDSLERKPRLL